MFVLFLLVASITLSSSLRLESCEDLHTAFEMGKTGNVNVSIHPFEDLKCDNFTTFSLSSGYDLDVLSTENLDNFHGGCMLENVRFEVTNGSKFVWETNAHFYYEELGDLPDVHGGAVYVEQGSVVRFLNDFETTNVGVRSQTVKDSDFSDHVNDGGCVWVGGYFRVDGDAVMTHCENSGGGESSPGRGGALFVESCGSVLFAQGVKIADVSIIDDEGNNGGGIYNLGKVNVRGDSTFTDCFAESAGAIYNGADAVFQFKNDASAIFWNCRSFDGQAGAIMNFGEFKFDGPAVFLEGHSYDRASQIYVGDGAFVRIKKHSYFFGNTCDEANCAPIYVASGGEASVSDTTIFVKSLSTYGDIACEGVFYEETGACSI